MAVTGHKSYAAYRKEHLDAGRPVRALISETAWKQGAADDAAPAVEAPASFHVTRGMNEVAQLSAGLTSVSGAGQYAKPGEALLYDEMSGKLYSTSDWGSVRANRTSLVSASGRRQQIAGAVNRTGKEDDPFVFEDKAKPFGVDVITDLGADIPEAGSEGFKAWLEKSFREGVQAQASANRYTQEKGGTGTGYGGYGSISFADWVAAGRPKKIGNDNLSVSEEDWAYLSGLTDEQAARLPGYLTTFDKETRHHGIVKAVGKLGDAVGLERLDDWTVTAANIGSTVLSGINPTAAAALRLAVDYDATGGDWRDTGKLFGGYVAGQAASAAVGLATGGIGAGAGLAGAIAGGAVSGAAGSAASTLATGLAYDALDVEGYSNKDLWNRVGESAWTGAVSGAVGGGLGQLPGDWGDLVSRLGAAGASVGLAGYTNRDNPNFSYTDPYVLANAAIAFAGAGNKKKAASEWSIGDGAGSFFSSLANKLPVGDALVRTRAEAAKLDLRSTAAERDARGREAAALLGWKNAPTAEGFEKLSEAQKNEWAEALQFTMIDDVHQRPWVWNGSGTAIGLRRGRIEEIADKFGQRRRSQLSRAR